MTRRFDGWPAVRGGLIALVVVLGFQFLVDDGENDRPERPVDGSTAVTADVPE